MRRIIVKLLRRLADWIERRKQIGDKCRLCGHCKASHSDVGDCYERDCYCETFQP